MQIQRIHVEGFGTLRDCRLSLQNPGLTVIYGSNGSGKSTLLEFLRGVFSNFSHAQELQLLPPLRGGSAGGSLQLAVAGGTFQVIRHYRDKHPETLAISVKQGLADHIQPLRERIERLPETLLRTLFMVGGFEAHAFPPLVNLARQFKIPLAQQHQTADWLSQPIQQLRSRLDSLYTPGSSSDELSRLQQSHGNLERQLKAAQIHQLEEIQHWRSVLLQTRQECDGLKKKIIWLLQEIGSVQSDMTEVQTRLWGSHQQSFTETEVVQEVVEQRHDFEWRVQIDEIEKQILNLQKVLRDLSKSRQAVTENQTLFVGADVPDPQAVFARQKTAIADLEVLRIQINELAEQLLEPNSPPVGVVAEGLLQKVESSRLQIWVLCQELSRQQSLFQYQQLQAEKQRHDSCEKQLIEQIQTLRRRRESLFQQFGVPMTQQQAVRSVHEQLYCNCESHEPELVEGEFCHRALEATEPKTVLKTRVVTVSDARPGDAAALVALQERLDSLERRMTHTRRALQDREWELERITLKGADLGRDRSVQAIQNELQLVELQIQETAQNYQTLRSSLQVLQRTHQEFSRDITPPLLLEASTMLRKMTGGRYVGLRYDESLNEIVILGDEGRRLVSRALSRGTHEQAALCLRLALVAEFQRRGELIPLVLDDILIDSDEDRSRRVVEVLIEAAKDQQILFLTCQEHLIKLFLKHGVDVVDLPGSVSLKFAPGFESSSRDLSHDLNRALNHALDQAAPLRPSEMVTPELVNGKVELPVKPDAVQLPETSGTSRLLATLPTQQVRESIPQQKVVVESAPSTLSSPGNIESAPVVQTRSSDSQRGTSQKPAPASDTATGQASAQAIHASQVGQRLQSSPRTWTLDPEDLLEKLISLSSVTRQRLSVLGIRRVGELAEFDPETLDIPLESLQLVPYQLKNWQAEVQLLCTLPGLEQHAARYLVLLGIVSAEDLSGLDQREFHVLTQEANRSDSLVKNFLQEFGYSPDWPSLQLVSEWIVAANHSRNWNSLRDSKSASKRTAIVPVTDAVQAPLEVASASLLSTQDSLNNSETEFMSEESVEIDEKSWRFYLRSDSPIVDAPSIGPKTAERLNAIGIYLVSDLLSIDPKEIAMNLGRREIDRNTVLAWQNQSTLVCTVPQLRGHDAQVLVACEILNAQQLSRQVPNELYKKVKPFVNSKDGQRMLRSSKVPDLQEVTDWIFFAKNSPRLLVGV